MQMARVWPTAWHLNFKSILARSEFIRFKTPAKPMRAGSPLVRNAERTIDVQSYLWRNDTTGNLILNELLNAADRGVRVRLLIDDNGVAGLDDKLNALDAHPDIEVRLFNPFVIRKPKWLGYITDFERANRRMHNKTFTVDNQVTIAGGAQHRR